jgi:hypothetical protein
MPHDQREMRFVSPVDLTIEAAASEDRRWCASMRTAAA